MDIYIGSSLAPFLAHCGKALEVPGPGTSFLWSNYEPAFC